MLPFARMVLLWLCVLCFNSYRLEWEKLGRVKIIGGSYSSLHLNFLFAQNFTERAVTFWTIKQADF